ncbi:MAG: glycosyltransferase family 4 protein [Bacteroidia bacterium]|nr:glycosyltransferase family 4 protein [Bacteroidia bacterium]MDG2041616.1 glycosyltransferase family 4 protein [Bacteroidia bacterium]|tara:strand:+ start:2118 stop:3320 length:1203 start_codon:yes stop_codon:yes gene_type:complete
MEKIKILQVSNRVPWPLNEGGNIGIYNYIKAYRELGHDVTFYCLDAQKHNTPIKEASSELSKYAKLYIHPIDTDINLEDAIKHLVKNKSYNVSRFYNASFEKELTKLLSEESFDLVQLEGTFVGPYISSIRKEHKGLLSLRMHNVEFEIWQRLAQNEKNPLKKLYLNILAKQLKKYESKIIRQVDTIVPVTDQDQTKFSKLYPEGIFKTIPAGINLNTWEFSPSKTTNRWYHIGSMEWHANAEAIDWYIENIHPLIIKNNTDYSLNLAGKGIDIVLFESIPQVNVTENVNNAYDFVNSNDVCIVPLKSGSGIRLKILEAMAAGKLVITTTIGAQGINYTNQKHLLIADTPSEFLSIFKKLNNHQIDFQGIIKNARTLIEKQYATKALAKKQLLFYRELLK